MTFLEKLLAREERVLLEARRHPLFMVLKAGPYLLGAMGLWILAVLTFVFVPSVLDVNIGLILGLILLAVSVVPLALGTYKILFWWREQYVVTSFRIIQIEGLMNRRTFDSALEKVNDVVMSQSVFGRMFNYGSINIVTGSDAAINDIEGVSKPFDFKRVLMEAKMDFGSRGFNEDGFQRTRRVDDYQPAPANREADTNRLPTFTSEQDQSRAVIALTELRNSGVISDAEFNEKIRRLTGSN
jgi:uncharacterized membrane protein YdbT with pleckstrin-like domain